MAFTKIPEFAGKALEKGLSAAIKAADLRWTDYGTDLKKSTTADNVNVGPVAYVTLNDPKNEDPVIAKIGTMTKMFFRCPAVGERYVMIECVSDPDAAAVAAAWVAEHSISLTSLSAGCPAAG